MSTQLDLFGNEPEPLPSGAGVVASAPARGVTVKAVVKLTKPPQPANDETPIPIDTSEPQSPQSENLKPRPSVAPATLGEVMAQLGAMPMAARKRADMLSAIRSLSRAVNRPPERISTSIEELGKLLSEVTPTAAGLTIVRWSRVRSLVLGALRLCGIEVMAGRETRRPSRAWQAALASLPGIRHRNGLSRLARFLSQRGVDPTGVVVEHFAAFHEALMTGSLLPKPEATYRLTVRVWNEVAGTAPCWPNAIVPLDPDPRRYSRPWEDFSLSFTEDVGAFLADSGHRNPLSDDYAKSVSPRTIDQRRRQIRQLASALIASGFPIAQLTGLDILVRLENAKAALAYLYARKGEESSKHLASQAHLIRTIARHWVKTRDDDIRLGQIAANLSVPSHGMVEKNRARLRQFDLPANQSALLNLPSRVLLEAGRTAEDDRREALRAMYAVAVEILIMAPMRLENLTALELGRHVVETRRGRERQMHLAIPSKETKTQAPFEMALPPESQLLIERYIAHYRPSIFAGDSPFLFPGLGGGRRASNAFSRDIPKFIVRETGLVMNVHLFRHLAAKLYLEANPHDIETVRRILSHRSTGTTLRSYADLASGEAVKRYDKLISTLRGDMAVIGPTPARRRAK